MIEVKVHIYTDGDFEIDNTLLDEEFEWYGATKFFDTEDEANIFLDSVFLTLNKAKNTYNQHEGLIDQLHSLRREEDMYGEPVIWLTSAVYMGGNQEIEIEITRHNKTKQEWLEQRINDISEEYNKLYGSFPIIKGSAK